jgi:hypothetical protein
MINLGKTANNFGTALKYYIVDTTALLTTSTPIYAAMETFGSGMSSDTSLEARLKVVQLSYMGLAVVYTKLRDLSKYVFNINDSSAEKVHKIHDSLYTTVFNIGISVPVYLSSGANWKQTLIGTGSALVLSFFITGPINGYGVDAYRDFWNLEKSNRLPEKIRQLTPRCKKGIAAALIGASVGLTSIVYEVKDLIDESKEKKVKSELIYTRNDADKSLVMFSENSKSTL